jgi:hypothetical protein
MTDIQTEKFPDQTAGLSRELLIERLDAQPLFENKTWQLSPFPWFLPASERRNLVHIGEACLAFHRALELLYTKSWQDKKLLRNGDLRAPWVAEYLDRGKPDWLINLSRESKLKGKLPRVIRPDLLWTNEGWVLTELDTVPGGIGLTAYLNQVYEEAPQAFHLLGGGNRMVHHFYHSVMEEVDPQEPTPALIILVSDEAATYRPEMEWLASSLQRKGRRVFVRHPRDLMPLGEGLCVDREGEPVRAHVIYRFFELFDWKAFPHLETFLDFWSEGSFQVTPPMRPFQEEKLSLALFHHPRLSAFWKESLSRSEHKILSKLIPQTWIVDNQPIPPNATILGPMVGGETLSSWEQLMEASQKDRNLILKISGFHETAWGARSVTLGSDSSRQDWKAALEEALASEDSYFVLQAYHKPARLSHPIYQADGSAPLSEGRLRLCPYYFLHQDKVHLEGALATFCPVDKKIIHGMSDAAMLPVAFLTEPPEEE